MPHNLSVQGCLLLWCILAAIQASACTTDDSCNLNGVCANATCICDVGWVGSTCDRLSLAPAIRGQGTCDPSLNGTATGYTTTWGGLPMLDTETGTWHYHVAEMALHCGMATWGSSSQIAHYASSSGVVGPYKRIDTSVAPWSHNPTVVAVPPTSAPAGPGINYLLFHIGIACNSVGVHGCNFSAFPSCENGTTPLHPSPAGRPVPIPPNLTRAWLHTAASLEGPWMPEPGGWSVPLCSNNPSPLFLRNGSLMVVCHEPFVSSQQSCPPSGGMYLATSATANWTHGAYTYGCFNLTNPTYVFNDTSFTAANEDPHLYADKRGGLHIISHNQSPCYQNASFYGADVRGCGGHFFSGDDGGSWTFTWSHAAYNGTVLYTDGSVRVYKRERPKLVQDVDLNLIALANGIGVEIADAFTANNDSACSIVVDIVV